MPTHVERVIAFGGSTSLGIGTENGHGWVQMLKERYHEQNKDLGEIAKRPRIFYELGVFAARAADLANNAPHDIAKRFWIPVEEGVYDRTKRLSIVSIGANDSWRLTQTDTSVTPLPEFSAHVERLATTLAEKSNILYVGPFAVDHMRCGTFWNTNTLPQIDSREEYEAAAAAIFRKVGAQTISFTRESYNADQYMSNLTDDGIHGTDKAEYWIFNRVAPVFDTLIRNTSELK